MEFTGKQGDKYFVTFTEVGIRYTFLIPVIRRSGVLKSIVTALNYTHTTFGVYPRLLHSYNANNFVSLAFKEATRSVSTAIRTVIPHNPEENGIAERVKRTLMNGVGCFMETANMPQEY